MNIDFRYRSIEIDKKKVVTSINIMDFPIEIDDDFFMFIFWGSPGVLNPVEDSAEIFSNQCLCFFFPFPILSASHLILFSNVGNIQVKSNTLEIPFT